MSSAEEERRLTFGFEVKNLYLYAFLTKILPHGFWGARGGEEQRKEREREKVVTSTKTTMK